MYLVGGKTSMADVLLLECTLMLEEKFCGILADFPNTKVIFWFISTNMLLAVVMRRKHDRTLALFIFLLRLSRAE